MQHYGINPNAVLQLYQLVLYGVASLLAFFGLLIFSIYFLLFVCGRTFQPSQHTSAHTSLKGQARNGRIVTVSAPKAAF